MSIVRSKYKHPVKCTENWDICIWRWIIFFQFWIFRIIYILLLCTLTWYQFFQQIVYKILYFPPNLMHFTTIKCCNFKVKVNFLWVWRLLQNLQMESTPWSFKLPRNVEKQTLREAQLLTLWKNSLIKDYKMCSIELCNIESAIEMFYSLTTQRHHGEM